MPFNPDFLNKNWYRKYPLRSTSTYQTELGTQLPLNMFAGMRISTIKTACDLYISKIVIKDNYINITVTDNTNNIAIGYFDGVVDGFNSSLKFIPIQKYAAGIIVIGILPELNGTHILSYTNGKIEDSLITCYNPPSLTAIKHEDKEARGHITFEYDNVKQTNFVFGVVDRSTVKSNADQGSSNLSCPTNILTGINTVQPDNDGNIDIYAIAPLLFVFDKGKMRLTSNDITTQDICSTNTNIPPLYEINTYKGYRADGDTQKNILITDTPEWKDVWVQYNGLLGQEKTQTGKASIKKSTLHTQQGKGRIA